MKNFLPKIAEDGTPHLEIDIDGADLLHTPLLNKGTGFSKEERIEFGLEGLLPPHVSTLEEQIERSYQNFRDRRTNLEKHINLRALQDRNEILYYAFVSRHLEEMMPIIYTPTVGEAVQRHSHIYRDARGLYLSPENVGKFQKMIEKLSSQHIEMIVVTDNQGILGIGDQGIGGMGIPIGKLAIYTLGAGIHPSLCLPISLDVGTDNEELLKDPLYLGMKHKRYTGEKYFDFIETFVREIKKACPKALLQWEDLSKTNAFEVLDRYREDVLSFNDDIQGTGAVAVAGILNAVKLKNEKITDQIFCIYGAGAGGVGVARQIYNTLLSERVSSEKAKQQIFVLDSRGLLTTDRENLEGYKKFFAVDKNRCSGWKLSRQDRIGLDDVVLNAKVTVLLGLSGVPGMFTQSVVRGVYQNSRRPIIFPLSNPTSQVEAHPKDILDWTDGNAIVATGSPFAPVEYRGKKYMIGQGNNAFVFPGVGLGALSARARKITDTMFTAASYRLSELVSVFNLEQGLIYPPVKDLPEVSINVAEAVFKQAIQDGVAKEPDRDLELIIRDHVWIPSYVPYHRRSVSR